MQISSAPRRCQLDLEDCVHWEGSVAIEMWQTRKWLPHLDAHDYRMLCSQENLELFAAKNLCYFVSER